MAELAAQKGHEKALAKFHSSPGEDEGSPSCIMHSTSLSSVSLTVSSTTSTSPIVPMFPFATALSHCFCTSTAHLCVTPARLGVVFLSFLGVLVSEVAVCASISGLDLFRQMDSGFDTGSLIVTLMLFWVFPFCCAAMLLVDRHAREKSSIQAFIFPIWLVSNLVLCTMLMAMTMTRHLEQGNMEITKILGGLIGALWGVPTVCGSVLIILWFLGELDSQRDVIEFEDSTWGEEEEEHN